MKDSISAKDSPKLNPDKVTVLGRFKNLPQKKLLLASCLLHVFFFSLLFVNWHSHQPIKQLHIPNNIQAHVVSIEDIQHFKDQKEEAKKALQQERENEKKRLEKQEQNKRDRELAQKRKREEALKRAAEERKQAEAKKLQIKKQKDEQTKKDLEKKRKLEEEQAKLKREKELIKQKQIEQQLADKKAAQIKDQENKLLEKLQQFEQLKKMELQKQKSIAAEKTRQKQLAFQEYELTETERFTVLIRTKIENLWRIPPKSEGLKVSLRIRLFPNGELDSVLVTDSSGNAAFDRSATLAVKSVRRYPLPEDSQIFENNFRQFTMSFSPSIP